MQASESERVGYFYKNLMTLFSFSMAKAASATLIIVEVLGGRLQVCDHPSCLVGIRKLPPLSCLVFFALRSSSIYFIQALLHVTALLNRSKCYAVNWARTSLPKKARRSST